MASYSTSEFKSGLKIILDKEPCVIISNEFIKPGKGQAFNRVKIRKILSDKVIDKTFKSGEKVEAADILFMDVVFLYNDTDSWFFMNESNFNQYEVSKKVIGDSGMWLHEQCACELTLWNDSVIAVEVPNFVNLEVTFTEPGLKGDTQGTVTKPATLSTGAIIKVPLFVKTGDVLKIDTRTKSYVERLRN